MSSQVLDWTDPSCHFTMIHQTNHPPKNGRWHEHIYCHELLIVLSGRSECVTDAGSASAEGSFAVFYPMKLRHGQYNDPDYPYEKYSINFPDTMLLGEALSASLLGNFCVIPLAPHALEKLVGYARILYDGYKNASHQQSEFERKCLLSAMVYELSRLAEGVDLYPAKEVSLRVTDRELVRNVCRWLNRNSQYDYSLSEIAEVFSVSVSRLTRIFRTQTGTTVQKYLLAARISKACSMLQDGIPIKDVSAQCGFRRSNYFSTTFTKVVGCTPATYRARFKKTKVDQGGGLSGTSAADSDIF